MVASVPGEDYLTIHCLLDGNNMTQYALTDVQQQLVRWTAQYSEKEMARVLRGKMNAWDFVQSLTDEMIANELRPYVERRLRHCFELLPKCDARIFMKDSAQRIYLSKEIFYDTTPAEAVFNFHYTPADGLRYFLSISHHDKEIALLGRQLILLVNQPTSMLLDNHLLHFKDIDSKKLIPFVRQEYIAVPRQTEEKYFKTFVVDNIRRYRVKADGFNVEDEPSEPIPILSLEKDLRYRPVLLLKFDYGNGRRPIEASLPFKTEASLEIREGRYVVKRFMRNPAAETAYMDYLHEQGFYNAGNSMFYDTVASANTANTDDCLANLVEKLNISAQALAEKKFCIDQKRYATRYFTGAVALDVAMKTEHDWFDVAAVVRIGEWTIPFIQLRRHILNGDRNYTLPNGETFVLPAAWMARYEHLMLMAERNADSLRISKRYFPLVNDAFEGTALPSLQALCQADSMPPYCAPESVHATLRPYQLQGVAWMRALCEHQLGGCLADDMGLGKTLQTICLLQSVIDEGKQENMPAENARYEPKDMPDNHQYVQLSLFDQPIQPKIVHHPVKSNRLSPSRASLVVMPASLVHNWANEIARFTPHLRTLLYIGADRQCHTRFDHYHIVLTTYGVLRKDAEILSKYRFLYAILDEAQYIRNPKSATYQTVTTLNADHYLTLSGTPIENSLTDLWAQMNFLNRGLLGSLNFFKEHFAQPIEKYGDETSRVKLQRIIQPFLLRRTKQEVAPELPSLTEQTLYCEMTEAQRSLYEKEKSKARNEIIGNIEREGVAKSGMMIFHALSRMRQLAIHPAMLDADYSGDSGKFERIIESLDNLRGEGHRALLFSSYTKHLNLVAAHLEQQNVPYAKLTGQTYHREDVIRQFNNSDVPFFLISLKAGGVGLNLTAADYVFLLDPWWNPAVEQQAISRTHRIGQSNNVFAYRMISTDTIEEKILQLQEKKSVLAGIFAASAHPFRDMTVENVMDLFT
ncbi:helicase [Bacteroidia bacterium]|nr:helicase [Bacteroidia bacterium]